MQPKIIEIPEKKLAGMRLKMSYTDNKTGLLWSQFMPRRKELKNVPGSDLFSLQGTDTSMKIWDIKLDTIFEKWALVEVADFENLPEGMEPFTLPAGKYAVFTHKGCTVPGFIKTMAYILGTWLPGSEFELDSRPDFEVLGEKYSKDDPNSEEEVWIPVKPKQLSGK